MAWRITLLALLAGFILASCGGSGDGDKLGTIADSERGGADRAGGGDSTTRAGASPEGSDDGRDAGGSSNRDGDDSSRLPADPRPPVDRAQVVRRADRICGAAHEKLLELSQELRDVIESYTSKRLSKREYIRRSVSVLRDTRRVTERAFHEMIDLPPPDRRKRDYGRYLGAVFQQSRLLAAQEQAIAKDRTKVVSELNRARTGAARRGHGFARRFGLRVCGGGI